MTQLFAYIDYDEQGKIDFEFSKYAQPFVFDLKNNFYSFHLRELANIKVCTYNAKIMGITSFWK